jgi:dynein heavy chain
MGAEKDDEEPQAMDMRMEFISEKIIANLKLKKEKFDLDEEALFAVKDFLDVAAEMCLLVYLGERDKVMCSTTSRPTPGGFKKKSCYFVKIEEAKCPLDIPEMRSNLVIGDFGKNPLDQMLTHADSIMTPLIQQLHADGTVPEVISADLNERLSHFVSCCTRVQGQVLGNTILPVPAEATNLQTNMDQPSFKDTLYKLEGAIVQWSDQIKTVLKTEPDTVLRDDSRAGIMRQVDFWSAKKQDLNSIMAQLNTDKVKKMLKVMKAATSTYLPAFERLVSDLKEAADEANEIVPMLGAMETQLITLDSTDDYAVVGELFRPILHGILLIWKHSRFFKTPQRLMPCMRMICNDFIKQSQKYCDGPTIFECEAPDALDKMNYAKELAMRLQSDFFAYKVRAQEECPEAPWHIPAAMVFGRLDIFVERIKDVASLLETMQQFQRLEKIEIGGTSGKLLTGSIEFLFQEFQQMLKIFEGVTYDAFEIDDASFDNDYDRFCKWVAETEVQIASVVSQGLTGAVSVESSFKLLHSFEGVIERPSIQMVLEKQYMSLLTDYHSDLKEILKLFLSFQDDPPIYNNMPPIAGALNWTLGLEMRATAPMAWFRDLSNVIVETDEMAEVEATHTHIIELLRAYNLEKQDMWAKEVDVSVVGKLKQSLLRQDNDAHGTLHVNFDPALVRMLREVGYFLKLDLDVPDTAMAIFKKAETFRTQTGNLDMVVTKYNWIQESLLDVERPLVATDLKAIDAFLEKGLSGLNWKSIGINEFVNEASAMVKGCETVLKTLKENTRKIEEILAGFNKPLLDSTEGQQVWQMEEITEQHEARFQEVQESFTDVGEQIHTIVVASQKVVRVNKGAATWHDYVDYLNSIVCDGFVTAISCSLKRLIKSIDPDYIKHNDLLPLVQVSLDLEMDSQSNEVVFSPDISGRNGRSGNLRETVISWVRDYQTMFNGMKRLCIGRGDYMVEVEERISLREETEKLMSFIVTNEEALDKYKETFTKHELLWTKDLNEAFQEWWEEVSVEPPRPEVEATEDGEEAAAVDDTPLPKAPPLEAFDAAITKYTEIRDEVNVLEVRQDVGWVRIDSRPVRQQVLYWADQWLSLYTDFLKNKVIGNMDGMLDFMAESSNTLGVEVVEGDSEALRTQLECIRDVKQARTKYDHMVEPLKAEAAMLKRFGVQIPESTMEAMNDGPDQWDAVKGKMYDKKQSLSDLYNTEGDKLKRKQFDFNKEVTAFRTKFQSEAPFHWSVGIEEAYPKMEVQLIECDKYGKDAAELRESQILFELVPGDYKEIRDSNFELRLLKQCWDMATLIKNTFVSWRAILWNNIDTEMLLSESKVLKEMVKKLDKKARIWDCFKGLDDEISGMMTSLPLIELLKQRSMRSRHWKELQLITGKSFEMDSSFCMENLMEAKLEDFSEDVEGVVIKSAKELVIEKNVEKIREVWDKMDMIYWPYPNDDTVHLMKVSEELVEAREEHQVALQAMQASKYIKVFEEQVNTWLKKLGMVEAVCQVWGSVQDKWMQLESIFIGSEDIRAQLPEDSKRFDTIDEDWRGLMSECSGIPSALEVCNRENMLEKLEKLEEMLDMCQKALDEYLGTKRTAFPRFYFVAPADLLDILSKGSNPLLIQPHYSKCFDNIGQLKFPEDEVATGKSCKALGMYSGEKEYVEFHEVFDATGKAVEHYLDELVNHSHTCLKMSLQDALATYTSDTRAEWLFNYCCQIVLVATMIWWNSEVSQAFVALEDGMETALKDEWARECDQLKVLTKKVQGHLEKGDRRKIVTLMTIDVHARDIVNKLILKRVENSQCFEWLSQLRLTWDDEKMNCFCDIADARFIYGYEYVGNCGRLVITPLTDRCYITLTQAMRLKMGGAPAGPAGTGKTETTKDLGRALGIIVYVFNCSPQMRSGVMANIFKGLAASGAWGCFDEFNRIAIETLSVVATQYRAVLVGIRTLLKVYPAPHEVIGEFPFDGEECRLVPTATGYITMNPGYAGRTELPENVKALFRSCAMIVPDMEMICEIMLFSEGFEAAKILARKFMLLFRLNKDLLSVQVHYDWGLRAVKSILVIAGGLKRADPDVEETGVLMRALRDCNVPKLVLDDVEVFLGTVSDIFPGIDLPRRRDEKFENLLRETCKDMKLQAEEIFIAKISALRELYEVRHSVFILGPPSTGKSMVWRTLAEAQTRDNQKTVFEIINPKSQDTNEMYGFIHPVIGWKDGVFSFIMRNYSQMTNSWWKWIVFDGDVDPDWIESLNTVMDDNKMLTLASNERVPLNPTMRLLVEVSNLRNASPATVSRGGVLMLNERDLGWRPFVDSWISSRVNADERKILDSLFNDYFDVTIDYMRRNIKAITNVMEITQVMTVCFILDSLLAGTEEKDAVTKEATEVAFVYACVWGFGGPLSIEKGTDYRKMFSEWWKLTWANVKFDNEDEKGADGMPVSRMIFDCNIDVKTSTLKPWDEYVPAYVHRHEAPFYDMIVSTADSVRQTKIMDMLTENQHHVQFVGLAGTAKTTIVKEKLKELPEDWSSSTIFLNSKIEALDLQLMMEANLEKRAGKTYTPIGNKKHIYFMDDLNMPGYDKWGTQTPIELLIQLIDHKFLFDRVKCGVVKEIKNAQFVAAMNPTAGSFQVSGRLQRQFSCLACNLPSDNSIETIYSSILKGHLSNFDVSVQDLAPHLVFGTISLHNVMLKYFLPNAIKFHYNWNLRELANIFQGVMCATPMYFPTPDKLSRLWLHECSRVYGDRLMTEEDMELFENKKEEVVKKCLEGVDAEKVIAMPNMFCTFCMDGQTDYLQVPDEVKLKKVLEEKLEEHNEVNANMDLVLFGAFAEHVTRISRILDKPRGNAMLVGVGGSGKQSLTKLTGFIGAFSLYQIQLTGSYNIGNLKEDILIMYKRAGAKSEKLVWLLTDAQITNEGFLVYINDYLSSGFLPDLFDAETKSDMINAVRSEVKAEGIVDTNENCFEFFINKVRENLHIVFCMSPVGEKMRVWCRKFPALINCSVIDWVHSWPEDALKSVAMRFIGDVDFNESDELRVRISEHMAFVHLNTVNQCAKYLEYERRYNYATPKSFLEYIDLYKSLLSTKRGALETESGQLEVGLQKLMQTEEDVGQLKLRLEEEAVFVKEKTESTEKLLVTVAAETEVVNEQKALAAIEEEKANGERSAAGAVQLECDTELAKAEPLVQSALAALDTLDKDAIGELKGFSTPPNGIEQVCALVIYMLSPEGKLAKDASFKAAKKAMANPGEFVHTLKGMDIDNIPRANITKVKAGLLKDDLDEGGANAPEVILGRSKAAGGLANWVVNIVKYDDCYQMITPLRNNLAEAKAKLEKAEGELKVVMDNVAELEAKLGKLTSEFESATAELNDLKSNAELTEKKLVMAERLVNGLADEKVRWSQSIKNMHASMLQLIGDTLIASAFVSYIGAFGAVFRKMLMEEIWGPNMVEKEVPTTEGLVVLDILSDIAKRAGWMNEGLPADQLSLENAAIVTNCARWPLIIDPQLQGVTWIKSREADNDLKVITQSGKFLDSVERAISMGNPLLIENLPEQLEAVLEPVLSRSTVKRGGMVFIKLGDKDDVEYDARFRLYLQTKMPNPHYQPEVAAQTTLINFTVTEKGLEDQLLAVVVQHERPDLEERLQALVRDMNECTKQLKELADGLLFKLSNAEGNLIEDIELIENLETTKVTAVAVDQKMKEGKQAESEIAASREIYRSSAARSSLIYFVLNQLWIVDHMYQFSLGGFMRVFVKAIDRAEAAEDPKQRVENITANVTFTLFAYASRGLFSRHKMIFSTQLCCRILQQLGENAPTPWKQESFDFLLRLPKVVEEKPQELEWLPIGSWNAANALKKLEGFENLANDLVSSSKRFKEWCDIEAPEREKLPLEYKSLAPLDRLCMIRVLRPDRMTFAIEEFIGDSLGQRYVGDVDASLENVLPETDPATPVYFILSPGVDVVGEIEKAAQARGFEGEKFSDVSLGEGKDVVSDREVDRQCKEGGWVVLQNVHLMPTWLIELEKRIESNSQDANPDFRLFITSDPSAGIPVALLQRSIKLTQEPPPGVKALYLRSWKLFDEQTFENSSKQAEMKSIVFCLSFFHAIMVERIKFGPQGWNRKYPFSQGDLTVCKDVTFNYLEAAGSTVPWDDLKYIYGEIMYGGHITDDFDRLLCATYLDVFMKDQLFEGLSFYPGYTSAPNLSHSKLVEYIQEGMGPETPVMFGMHANAEIGFRTDQSDTLCAYVFDLQPRTTGGGGGSSMLEVVMGMIDEFTDKLAEGIVDMEDLVSRIEAEGGRTPYVNVFYQECKYMNTLVSEIQKSLEVLKLGLLGELQMSSAMEELQIALFSNKVPASWNKVGFVSMRPLAGWMNSLMMRLKQLQDWVVGLTMPKSVWITGFYNPQSFITAILQTLSRKNEWPLDKVVVATEVTKKQPEEVEQANREGSYIHGLTMEGARWDMNAMVVAQSLPKEMFCPMPVLLAKAIPVEKAEFKDTFMCPVYKVQMRGATYVFKANLKTKVSEQVWIMAGAAMLMDVVQ